MSVWENPIKKSYDRLVQGKSNNIEQKEETKENIIDLSTIMQIKPETEVKVQGIEYIVAPIVSKYNGARADSFNAMQIAEISTKYLDFSISNGIDQKTMH